MDEAGQTSVTLEAIQNSVDQKADIKWVSNLETRIKDIEDKLDGLDVRVCNEAAERTDSNSKESIDEQIDEMKERDRRKNNLIIFNVEESSSEDIAVRKQHVRVCNDVRVCNEAAERTDSNSKESIDEQIDEMKERDRRKNNLIIFNVEEKQQRGYCCEKTARHLLFIYFIFYKHIYGLHTAHLCHKMLSNMDEITKLLSVGLGVSSEVINPIRLGPKISDSKWPRPLRVSVDSESTKWNILKQSKNLTGQGKEMFQTVFIKRDMTPMEREKDLLLRNQLKEKRKISEDKGEQTKWIIRSGKIIAQK